MSEVYTCLYCGDVLTGRQRKFCSDAHRQAYNRRVAREARREAGEDVDAQNRATPAVVSIEKYSAVVASNQALQAQNDMLDTDVTRLRNQVDQLSADVKTLTGDVINATKESAESSAALAAERRLSRLLLIAVGIVGALAVLAAIALIVVGVG